MTKHKHERTLEQGEELLRSWGLSPSSQLEDLAAHIGRDLAADVAIAYWLGGRPVRESVELLQRIQATATDKSVRREVRRALYRLEQRGVLPRSQPQEVVARPLSEPPSLKVQGFFLPYLLGGYREFVLLRKRPGGVVVLLATTRQYDRFLQEIVRAEFSGKEWREFVARSAARGRVLAEGDAAYCDFLLWRAYESLPPHERRPSLDYPAFRAELFPDSFPSPRSSPLLDLYPLQETGSISRSPSELAAAILNEPALLVLVADKRERLQPYVERIREAESSPLVLSDAQKQERRAQIERQAVEELFGEEERGAWVHCLRELGYYFHLIGKRELARELALASGALERPKADPKQIPFCVAFIAVGLLAELYQLAREEQEKAEGSLIVTPEQLRRARRGNPSGRGEHF